MADQEGKQTEQQKVAKAINKIAATEAGIIFFRWLAKRCFAERSTIAGNPETYEVNTVGSMCNAYLQRLYFDIRRAMDKENRIKIEQ